MSQTIRIGQCVTVTVTAASLTARQAVLTMASTLGLEPGSAEARLSVLPAVLAENVSAPEARRMSALLSAFGFQVRLEPFASATGPVGQGSGQMDLAVQLIAGIDHPAPVERLAQVLGRDTEEIVASLAGPEGIVLRNLNDARVLEQQKSLEHRSILRLVISDPAAATFDAFAKGDAVPSAELSRLGLCGSTFSDAVATGLNNATAAHLVRRAGDRVSVYNRAFQRYDLFLASAPGLGGGEVARFLERRGKGVRGTGSDGGHWLEKDLSHDAAQQFISDYSAIGLQVRAKLRGHNGLA